MKYRVFDLDGTLADSMRQWGSNMIKILNIYGVEYPADVVKIVTPLGDIGTAEYFINELHVNATVEELCALMDKFAFDVYNYDIPIKDGVKEYLESLKANGDKLYVLTASPHKFLDPCLKRNGVYDLFDILWSIEDFGTLTKNMPEIYYEAAERIGAADMSSIVFYDDNVTALKTAKSTGIKTVGIYDFSSEPDQEEIKELVDVYALSFTDLLAKSK